GGCGVFFFGGAGGAFTGLAAAAAPGRGTGATALATGVGAWLAGAGGAGAGAVDLAGGAAGLAARPPRFPLGSSSCTTLGAGGGCSLVTAARTPSKSSAS